MVTRTDNPDITIKVTEGTELHEALKAVKKILDDHKILLDAIMDYLNISCVRVPEKYEMRKRKS